MRFIISPAKKMAVDVEVRWRDMPRFLDKSREVVRTLNSMSFEELHGLWKCSEKLARETFERMWMLSEEAAWDMPPSDACRLRLRGHSVSEHGAARHDAGRA